MMRSMMRSTNDGDEKKHDGVSEQSVSVTMDRLWSDALCIFYNSSLFFSRTPDTYALFGK